MTEPFEFVLSNEEAMPEIARPVAVADVPAAVVKVKDESADEAGARKPLRNARVVEVAFSPELRVVNGKTKPGADERVPLVKVRFAPTVRGANAPLGEAYGIWEGRESVQVLLVDKSCAPAEEVIWLVVPLMVMVVAGVT